MSFAIGDRIVMVAPLPSFRRYKGRQGCITAIYAPGQPYYSVRFDVPVDGSCMIHHVLDSEMELVVSGLDLMLELLL